MKTTKKIQRRRREKKQRKQNKQMEALKSRRKKKKQMSDKSNIYSALISDEKITEFSPTNLREVTNPRRKC